MDDFWRMNPNKLERNLPYYAEQQKRSLQTKQEDAWLFGQYVMMAVGTCLAGSSKCPYPDAPPDLYKTDSDEEKIVDASIRFRASIMEDNKRRYGVASLKPDVMAKADKERGEKENG